MTALVRGMLAALTALALLGLSACTPDDVPPPPTTAPPSESPLFASDEEALAAAVEAYEAYQEVEDLIFAEGGARGERIDSFATGAALEAAKQGFEEFQSLGYRSVGSSRFELISLQSFNPFSPDGLDIVTAYLCLDVSAVDVVDGAGASVVHAGRPNKQSFEVHFDRHDDYLLLSGRDPWPGGALCAG